MKSEPSSFGIDVEGALFGAMSGIDHDLVVPTDSALGFGAPQGVPKCCHIEYFADYQVQNAIQNFVRPVAAPLPRRHVQRRGRSGRLAILYATSENRPVNAAYTLPNLVSKYLPELFIHIQQTYSRSSDGGQSCDLFVSRFGSQPWKGKMLGPNVPSGMKQASHFPAYGIYAGQVRSLLQIALPTSKREIIKRGRSSMLFSDDVLDVQRARKRGLRN